MPTASGAVPDGDPRPVTATAAAASATDTTTTRAAAAATTAATPVATAASPAVADAVVARAPRGRRRLDGAALGVVRRRAAGAGGLDPFTGGFVAGLEQGAARAGGHVVLRVVDDPADELAAYEHWGLDGWVRGVVLLDVVDDDPRLPVIDRAGLPVVVLGRGGDDRVVHVEVDDAGAVRAAVEHLLGLGHRRLGRVSGPTGLRHTRLRSAALAAAAAAGGATACTVPADYTEEGGAAATRDLLSRPDRPTAVVYDNDLMALGGLRAALGLGLAVPGDVSLVAWDDSAPCQLAEPPLTVVGRDVHGLGEAAADALLDLLAGGAVRDVATPAPVVVVRGTSAPPAVLA